MFYRFIFLKKPTNPPPVTMYPTFGRHTISQPSSGLVDVSTSPRSSVLLSVSTDSFESSDAALMLVWASRAVARAFLAASSAWILALGFTLLTSQSFPPVICGPSSITLSSCNGRYFSLTNLTTVMICVMLGLKTSRPPLTCRAETRLFNVMVCVRHIEYDVGQKGFLFLLFRLKATACELVLDPLRDVANVKVNVSGVHSLPETGDGFLGVLRMFLGDVDRVDDSFSFLLQSFNRGSLCGIRNLQGKVLV